MGEVEERLKTGSTGKTTEKPQLKSELEKALEEEESELARELRLTRGEEAIAKHQARIKELREQLGKGGTGSEKTEAEKQEAEKKLKEERIEQAKALYNSCVEAGGEPKQCAEMVAGLIPTSAPSVSAPPATSITDLVHALKELDSLRGTDKGVAELKTSFDQLANEIKRGNQNQKPLDPITFAKQQAEQTRAYYDTLKALGIIKEGESSTYQGEPLEVIKEKHHHEERMNELSADREYKQSMADIAGSIPERVGHGMASQFTEGEKEPSGSSSGSELEYLTCQEEGCGFRIPVPPNASSQITCPKCGSIYTRKQASEESQE